MDRKFFVGSVGKPGEEYSEENRVRCIALQAHVMHEDTMQKGVFERVNAGDICFLKYNEQLICFGEVVDRVISTDESLEGWTYLIKVKTWFFFDEKEKKKGVNKYGIAGHTFSGAGQMGTVKEIDSEYGLQKMMEIAGENNALYIKVKKEIGMNTGIELIQNLLEKNKNLILTGAPGTGKTYLAKQIAKKVVSQETKTTPLSVLKTAIDGFVTNEETEEQYKDLRNEFLGFFPAEKLRNMSLEDYCIGNSDRFNNNFCYWMEKKLIPLGKYFPGSSKSYMLYWSKTDDEYKVHGYLKALNRSPEELIKTLAQDISKMVVNNDPMSMYHKIGDSFILKILSTYYPNQYAPINSKEHIDNIISLFNIQCSSENVFDRNKAIYQFYKEQTKGKTISSWSFMRILYDNFNIKEGEILQNGQIVPKGEWSLVQFHPSYDYTDFVEGLRPVNGENGQIGFERKDGVFKEFCEKALQNLIDSEKSVVEIEKEKSVDEKINAFISDAIEANTEFEIATGNKFYITNMTDKSIVVSIPANEKTNELSVPRTELHALLSSDKNIENGNDIREFFTRKWRTQQDSYTIVLYKKIKNMKTVKSADSISKTERKDFIFIIDEINRGEMSKIFGELFFAIEPSYRGAKKCDNLRTQYANLQETPNLFDSALGKKENFGHFFIPENVYIIGTMNDIDRSVESMDFAFRRRFTFMEIKTNENLGMLDVLDEEIRETARQKLFALNDAISKIEGLSSAYHIGGAYFLKLKELDNDFEKLWKYHLEGLLREYLRGMENSDNAFAKLKEAYGNPKNEAVEV